MDHRPFFIGTAGWSIAARYSRELPEAGSHLERYASRVNATEVNSSFYRPHQRETYARWAQSVPDDFRFSVKVPRTITHEHRLAECDQLLDQFLQQAHGLGRKLAVLLVQLPPNLRFDPGRAESFLRLLRQTTDASIVCEPRHASWFAPAVDAMLKELQIARVAADPGPCDGADSPGGWTKLAYFRMHGSPRIYRSDYPVETLVRLRQRLDDKRRAGSEVWCIFDNTTESHALGNALALTTEVSKALR